MRLGFLAKVVGLLLAVECLAALAFEWLHQRWSNVDVDRQLPSVPNSSRPSLGALFAGFRHLAAPYFTDAKNVAGRFCCVTIVVLGLLGLFLAYVHNMWHKEWWDLFQKGDASNFARLMGIYVVIVAAVVLVQVYVSYVRSWLYIDWREFMTQRLAQRWLSGHTHFLMQVGGGGEQIGGSGGGELRSGEAQRVDNPDQRLQEDVHLFVRSALDICPEFLESAGSLFVFVPIVLATEPQTAFGITGLHVPGWLLILALVYSVLGGLCTHLIGWPMITYSFARQRYEADFRHLALHIRDNSESVALYNSEATERSNLQEQFGRIKLVQWRQMVLEKRLSFFTNAYGFVQFLVPFFILAPSYFKKEISLGDLFQLTGAIAKVASSFDWFLRVYGPLSDWRATADRLLAFEAAIGEVHQQFSCGGLPAKREKDEKGSSPALAREAEEVASELGWLRAEMAEVRLPCGEPVWRDVEVALRQGQRLLISGPEGAGKSVLFKALAGIWPHTSGSELRLPVPASEVVFVPQRPALPKRCSLAEAVSYPETPDAYEEEAILQALRDVRLEELVGESPPGATPSEASTRSLNSSRGSEASAQPWSGALASPAASPVAVEALAPAPVAAQAAGAAGVCGPSTGTPPAAALKKPWQPPLPAVDAGAGLRQVDCWGSRLSPGQQQRLAIGHLLLRRPKVLFLDEATSNVSKGAAAELYEVVMRQLPGLTIVSISHDVATLEPLHDVHVAVQGEGSEKVMVVAKGGEAVRGRGC